MTPEQMVQEVRAGLNGVVTRMHKHHDVEIAELRSQLKSVQEQSDMFEAECDRLEQARMEDEERAQQQITREEDERLYLEAVAEEEAFYRQFDDDDDYLRQTNQALRDMLKADEERAAQTTAMLNATQRETISALNKRQGDVNMAQRNCTETQKAEIQLLRAQVQEQSFVLEAARHRQDQLSNQVQALQAKIIELHETRGDVADVTEGSAGVEQQSTDSVASRTRKRRAERTQRPRHR